MRLVYRAFQAIDPYVGWFCLLAGLVMFLLTFVGVASFGDGWKVYFASLAGWLVLAAEGFDRLTDYLDDGE